MRVMIARSGVPGTDLRSKNFVTYYNKYVLRGFTQEMRTQPIRLGRKKKLKKYHIPFLSRIHHVAFTKYPM